MRTQEILVERASSVLYHYTDVASALNIVSKNQFELSSVVGNPSEESYSPAGYPYFISMARTRLGDYHNYVGTSGVLFVLDGDWFNDRYIVKPIDYFSRAWLQSDGTRTREAEDRVFSKEPIIPAVAITSIHVLLKSQDEYRSPRVRKLMIAAKRRQTPIYLYKDDRAWRLLDTRRSIKPKQASDLLRGPDPAGSSGRSYDYLEPWMELLYKKSSRDLTPRGEKLLHNLLYYLRPGEDSQLGLELSNARKPSSGASRDSAVKIIKYMADNRIKSTADLSQLLFKKWKDIVVQDRKTKLSEDQRRDLLKKRARTRAGVATRHVYGYENTYLSTFNRLNQQRDLPSLTKLADKIWAKYYTGKRKRANIRFGPGTRELGGVPMSYAEGYDTIELAPGQRDILTLIHELAHMMGPSLHGLSFTKAYYSILKDFLPASVRQQVYDELVTRHSTILKPHYRKIK